MFNFIKSFNLRVAKNVLKPNKCRCLSLSGTIYNKNDEIDVEQLDAEDKDFAALRDGYFGRDVGHSCYIIHPYIKWGQKKERITTPEKQIQEAESLIRTLATWKIHNKSIISMDNLDKKFLFGSGNLEKLKSIIRSNKAITAVFVNISTLSNTQMKELELQFQIPIYDRYRIVMEILRLHALSKHAKLQVALAEVSYLWKRLEFDVNMATSSNKETQKLMLQSREQKIKNEIKKLRSHRELLRNKRKLQDYPIVAVVGYTNCGKTSLIKCLTGSKSLEPKDQLFATLDVTVHEGVLPSYMKVLYVDTVGFIANIPTSLIECFIATLEDAMFADVIIHVQDISSEDHEYQKIHVLKTLDDLAIKTGSNNKINEMITVANKSDLIDVNTIKDLNILPVSAETGLGLSKLLHEIEGAVIKSTNRECISFKLPTGGDEIRWLYKNSTVVSVQEIEGDSQLQRANVIITIPKLRQFKHQHLDKRNKKVKS